MWIGDQWFAVVGILDPVPLLGSLDSSVFIGGRRGDEAARLGRQGLDDLRADPAEVGRRRPRRARRDGQPAGSERGRGVAADRCARGPLGRRPRAHGAAARARRRGAARRRHRHRQRDGHLGARTSLRDRGAAGDRRDPPPHPAAVPDRGGDPRLDRRRRWGRHSVRPSLPCTPGAGRAVDDPVQRARRRVAAALVVGASPACTRRPRRPRPREALRPA